MGIATWRRWLLIDHQSMPIASNTCSLSAGAPSAPRGAPSSGPPIWTQHWALWWTTQASAPLLPPRRSMRLGSSSSSSSSTAQSISGTSLPTSHRLCLARQLISNDGHAAGLSSVSASVKLSASSVTTSNNSRSISFFSAPSMAASSPSDGSEGLRAVSGEAKLLFDRMIASSWGIPPWRTLRISSTDRSNSQNSK